MLAPRSYTGEDVVELQCHGSEVCMRRVLRACLEGGARLAEPGEFTLRAFLNGRLDLSQAENVGKLISAHSVAAADAALAGIQVVVVSGETGCGKTTQLPQYILESEIEAARGAACSVICTQPRRISAMSVAERVAAEQGENLGESVGYKVRLEGMKGRDNRLLFFTTSILLRRLLVDRNLQGITHVIVDEIHERGMNEDFLLIVLKELLPRRPELRLILMSATLNAELFSSYFGGAPMIHIPVLK